MIPAREAYQRLVSGNRRFLEGDREIGVRSDRARREAVSGRQSPIAVVIGCSDSRVPPEIIFDQGLGELFDIRIAGNIVAAEQIGSAEFAVDALDVRLIVVLGHSDCGIILAAVDQCARPDTVLSPNLQGIVDHLQPLMRSLSETEGVEDPEALGRAAVRANIRNSMRRLTEGSPLIARRIREDGLRILGAEYSLDDGGVDFFAGVVDLDD